MDTESADHQKIIIIECRTQSTSFSVVPLSLFGSIIAKSPFDNVSQVKTN